MYSKSFHRTIKIWKKISNDTHLIRKRSKVSCFISRASIYIEQAISYLQICTSVIMLNYQSLRQLSPRPVALINNGEIVNKTLLIFIFLICSSSNIWKFLKYYHNRAIFCKMITLQLLNRFFEDFFTLKCPSTLYK